MRALSHEERIALREIGPPGEGPVSPETFATCEREGWGAWVADAADPTGRGVVWAVTARGARALAIDDVARGVS
jgi:hypothetical protein